jgi:hypothetical protein
MHYAHYMANEPNDRLFQMRVSEGFLHALDAWRRQQPDLPPRAEAIRRLVEIGIANTPAKRRAEPDSPHRAGMRSNKATQASEMASTEVDRLGDPLATDEERQLRKRRLIKGPKEFRDIRNAKNRR